MKEGPEPGNISFQWQLPPERARGSCRRGLRRHALSLAAPGATPEGQSPKTDFPPRASSSHWPHFRCFALVCTLIFHGYAQLRLTVHPLKSWSTRWGGGAGITPVLAGVLALCLTSRQAGRRRKWQPIVQQHALLPGVSLGTEPSGAATSKGRTRPPPRGRCGGGS